MDTSPVIFAPPESAGLLIELEARQDDVLRQLDELNAQIEHAITSGQLNIIAKQLPNETNAFRAA